MTSSSLQPLNLDVNRVIEYPFSAQLLYTGYLHKEKSLIVHQKLSREGEDVVPRLTPLSFLGDDSVSVRSLVKERKWSQLKSEISRQMNSMRLKAGSNS